MPSEKHRVDKIGAGTDDKHIKSFQLTTESAGDTGFIALPACRKYGSRFCEGVIVPLQGIHHLPDNVGERGGSVVLAHLEDTGHVTTRLILTYNRTQASW